MNFTADYISLCKNEKVQGLRKKLEVGDWIFSHKMEKAVDHEEAKGLFIVMDYRKDMAMYWLGMDIIESDCDEDTLYGESRTWDYRNDLIWLPTSGQLDQHIIERLDDGGDYTFIYTNFSKEAGHYNAIVYEGGEVKEQATGETNPLIAKIKLLISLLKEE